MSLLTPERLFGVWEGVRRLRLFRDWAFRLNDFLRRDIGLLVREGEGAGVQRLIWSTLVVFEGVSKNGRISSVHPLDTGLRLDKIPDLSFSSGRRCRSGPSTNPYVLGLGEESGWLSLWHKVVLDSSKDTYYFNLFVIGFYVSSFMRFRLRWSLDIDMLILGKIRPSRFKGRTLHL